MDGTAAFNVFELSAPIEITQSQTYVTKEELDAILASFKESLALDKTKENESSKVKVQVNQPFNL